MTTVVRILDEKQTSSHTTVEMLNAEVSCLGGPTRTDGSAAGAAHRAWLSLADAVGDKNGNAAERVEEGEDYICEKLKEAIDDGTLSPPSLAVVQKAYQEIQEGERVTNVLEEAYD